MPRARIVEIKSSLSLEIGKEALKEFEIPVADRGIRFKDNMQWPDQYVVTWIDALHFKIANWVHPMGLSPRDYGEDEFWEVEISGDAAQPVFRLQKHPVNFKNNILIFLVLVLASAVSIRGKLISEPFIVLGWSILFVVFFFRTFIFEDETTLCVRYLERLLNPEKNSK